MTMYNLIEYSHNYSETSGSLWQSQMITQQILNHLNLN